MSRCDSSSPRRRAPSNAPPRSSPRSRAPTGQRAATRATYLAFAGSGFTSASFASRIPEIRDRLELSPSALGAVLLAIAAGSVIALPLSGPVIARHQSRPTLTAAALLGASGMVAVAIGNQVGLPLVVAGLFVVGVALGGWDVAMNVQGAAVERRARRAVMPRFHACFSIGMVAGALVGAGMILLRVGVTAHLAVAGVLVGLAVARGARRFIGDHAGESPSTGGPTASARNRTGHSALAVWREPRTLLLGLFVLSIGFAEGAGNDWIAVAVVDGHRLSPAVGTLAFAAFLGAATAVRWSGAKLLERWGRVLVVRASVVSGTVGLLLFVFAEWSVAMFFGAALWGVGVSIGFPVGMSAGADDPDRAAARVSAISSIGYCGFLAGPPLIGTLGDGVGALRALLVVVVALVVALAVAGAVRNPEPAPLERRRD